MKASEVKYTVLTWVSVVAILIILLVPFHAFLTVWGSSLVGHYTVLRLWKEILLLFCGLASLFLLFTDHKIREHTLSRRLVWLIAAYSVVTILWGLVAYLNHAVTLKAYGYGLVVNLRFLFFFLITWLLSLRLVRMRTTWQWITLWPAAVVVAFGLLQIFVLPHNFLSHFGYNLHTIPAYETINHNAHYIRIMSTLRGANPLGAYLIIPISFLSVLLLHREIDRKQVLLLMGAAICLIFTFSRSAWIGAFLSLAIATAYSVKDSRRRQYVGIGAVALLIIGGGLYLTLHNNVGFQNYVLHTQKNSLITATSDAGHSTALKQGLHDVVHEPLGRGTGTAGPASVYNTGHPIRIAENYYLQIGQETGWIGLALFVLINVGVGYLLWLRRSDSLSLALLASLIGISFVNMLSHAWTDDTLAYVWWGLAGIAMAPNLKKAREAANAEKPHKN